MKNEMKFFIWWTSFSKVFQPLFFKFHKFKLSQKIGKIVNPFFAKHSPRKVVKYKGREETITEDFIRNFEPT